MNKLDHREHLRERILVAESQRQYAMNHSDIGFFDAHYDENLYFGHSNGNLDTKKSYVEKLRSKELVYEDLTIEVEGITIVSEHVGMAYGSMRGFVNYRASHLIVSNRFLTVWVARGDRILLSAHQTAPLQ